MTWPGALWSSLWTLARGAPAWLLGALGALAALAFAYLRGRSGGRAAERASAGEAALESKRTAERLEREIEGLPESALDARGEPWVRR